MKNWKGDGKEQLWPDLELAQTFLGGKKDNNEKLKTVCVRAWIQTEHYKNASVKRNRYTKLPQNCR